MKNKMDVVKSLRQEIQQLREKIESGEDSLAVELGFPKLLVEIEEVLAAAYLDKANLEQLANGIFRLVTESFEFEESDLGKQLLDVRTKIRDFLRA